MVKIKDESWIKEHIVSMRDRTSFEMILDYPLVEGESDIDHSFSTNIYFFPPASLSTSSSWHQRDRFYQHLKNNLRWHTPEESTETFKFPKTKEYISKSERIEEKNKLIEDVIGENKLFANRIIKKLKSESEDIHDRCSEFFEFLQRYRTEIIETLVKDSTVHDQVIKHSCWCDEFLSYYFKNFLLKNSLECDEKWRSFLDSENSYILRYKDYKVASSFQDRRRFLQRASMLKKFVNEILYLDLKQIKKTSYKKNIAAACAAGLAASVNFFATYSAQYGDVGRDSNLKFFILLLLAVGIYVFKDRVKDITKEYFNNRMLSLEPDYKYDILSKKMPGLPVVTLGQLRENLDYCNRSELPDEVYYVWKKARSRATGSLLGHGEVMWYQKVVSLNEQSFNFGKNWSIKDVMRFDLKDFYSVLEEFQGHLNIYDEDEGKIELESEKSYSLDIVVKLEKNSGKKKEAFYQTYRIFLERDGIIDIEDTSEEINYFYREELA